MVSGVPYGAGNVVGVQASSIIEIGVLLDFMECESLYQSV